MTRTKVTRMIRVVFLLWLAVSFALVLTWAWSHGTRQTGKTEFSQSMKAARLEGRV
jgi:hypothetical protein